MPLPLPVNLDTTYADDTGDPTVQLHQAHHDDVHHALNQVGWYKIAKVTAAGGETSLFSGNLHPSTATDAIGGNFQSFKAIYNVRSNVSATFNLRKLRVRLNSDSGTWYHMMAIRATGTTVSAQSEINATGVWVGDIPTALGGTDYWGSGEITVPDPTVASRFKNVLFQSGCIDADASLTTDMFSYNGHGVWRNVANAVVSMSLVPETGGFVAGSTVTFYGLR